MSFNITQIYQEDFPEYPRKPYYYLTTPQQVTDYIILFQETKNQIKAMSVYSEKRGLLNTLVSTRDRVVIEYSHITKFSLAWACNLLIETTTKFLASSPKQLPRTHRSVRDPINYLRLDLTAEEMIALVDFTISELETKLYELNAQTN